MTDRLGSLHRRDWVRSALLFLGASRAGLGSFRARLADPVEAIKAKGRSAKLQPFEASETEHFVGVGDAPSKHRLEALELCESFATDYFVHFRAKEFAIEWPSEKLPVVILSSPQSYAAFEATFPDEAVGGHYDLEANWLVTFDFRGSPVGPRVVGAADPRLDNTLALVHETFHLLSYNTGFLSRKVNYPLCLTEGLATYAETWRPARKGTIGAINVRRRKGLELALKEGLRWLPVKDLIARDGLLTDPKTEQAAYAESCMLVAKLLKDPSRLAPFRDYLREIEKLDDPARRVALATTHLGDLTKLDKEIRK